MKIEEKKKKELEVKNDTKYNIHDHKGKGS